MQASGWGRGWRQGQRSGIMAATEKIKGGLVLEQMQLQQAFPPLSLSCIQSAYSSTNHLLN